MCVITSGISEKIFRSSNYKQLPQTGIWMNKMDYHGRAGQEVKKKLTKNKNMQLL